MANLLNRLFDLMPVQAEFVGTVQHAEHPNYKVLVVDGTGLVSCTSSQQWYQGQRVFVQGMTIMRLAPSGDVIQIEV